MMMVADLALYLRNQNRLRRFHNVHRGERCVIIGNGPSIAGMDLSALRGEKTFGLNRIYLLFQQMGYATTYLVAINRHVIRQFSGDILSLPCTKFISWYSRQDIGRTRDVIYLRPGKGETFSGNPLVRGIWEGATVTFVAMQLAYFMGFSRVVLIGVDHSFQTKGDPHRLIVSDGPDRNHFDPEYFGKGVEWQLPDLETSERAYRQAKTAFEQDGREIVDATVGGKLEVFRKVEYNQIFGG